MNLLLDTHTVLWWYAGLPVARAAAEAIAEPDNLVYVSAASLWEMAVKAALGKLDADLAVLAALIDADFEALAVTSAHALTAGGLPAHHRDPFDRMLIAQAQLVQLTVVTRDPSFGRYDVALLAA